jgi:predicted permease
MLGAADRLFGALLWLLPLDFRRECGADVARTFREASLDRQARDGWPGVLALWCAASIDLLWQAVAERASAYTGRALSLRARARSVRPTGGPAPGGNMSGLFQDVRYAFRSLRRTPALTLTLILTLGLGIGGTTAIFTVVYGVLLRPLPFPDADRVVRLCEVRPSLPANLCVASAVNVADLARGSATVEAAGVARDESFVFASGVNTVGVAGGIATPGFFAVLGATPAHGRLLVDSDLAPGSNHVAVVSHRFWASTLNSDPNAVGRLITLDERPYRVVGVLSPTAYVPTFGWIDVWKPLTASVDDVTIRSWRGFVALAKARAGITRDALASNLASTHARLQVEYPRENAEWSLRTEGLRERLIAPVQGTLWVFQGAAMLVLIIACANAAGLLLVRATTRAPEFAVRIALGAGRGRLLRQLLSEGAILSLAGMAAGLLVASWATAAMVRLAPSDIPRLDEVSLNGTVAAFALLVAAATTVFFAVAPMRRPRQIALTLRGQRNAGERSRVRTGFVFVQLTLAFALLVGASLLTRAFVALSAWDPGFQKQGVFITWLLAPAGTYRTTGNAVTALMQARDRVAALPGVQSAGLASAGPMFSDAETGQLTRAGAPAAPEPVEWFDVDPYYFDTLGARVLRGRGLSLGDTQSAPPVAVVNETFARRFFARTEPVGQRVTVDEYAADIVGIVPDFRPNRPDEAVAPQIFWPIQQYRRFAAYLVVRVTPGVAVSEDAIRAGITGAGPALQMTSLTSLDTFLDRSLVSPMFNMAVLGVFALVAVALAAVGVYGVIAYSVTCRTREIGLRVALGATPATVMRQFVMDTSRLALAGATAGLALAVGLERWFDHLLYGVPRFDPLSLSGVIVIFLIVALTAGYVPAHRASRIDPARALAAD